MQSENRSQIFDTGYEKWEGDRVPSAPSWALIGEAGLRNVVSSSGCLGRFIFIIYLVIYYAFIIFAVFVKHQAASLAKMDFMRMIGEQLGEYLAQFSEATVHANLVARPALGFTVLALMFYGAQLIAKDKAANAMQVYFSKAVVTRDYLLGKYLAVSGIVALVTLVPSALMLVLGVLFSSDFTAFMRDAWTIPISAGLVWLVLTASLGTFILFFSSCFSKPYMASISFLGFMLFSSVGAFFLRLIFGSRDVIAGLSWSKGILNIIDSLYTWESFSSSLLAWQLVDLTVVCLIFVWIMVRNTRPVEVVK
ncbi:MAG: hypothetical protein KDC35_04210 [Acidobacteria bacterium]|nr:hypothetical protein [Acidobacteriota bacterium]